MAWPFNSEEKPNGDGESKPPEKSPAELIAESVSAALKPFADRLDNLATDMASVKESTKPRQPEAKPMDLPSVFDNEDAAFNLRLTPIMARQLELEARVALKDIKYEYQSAGFGDLWSQYESDINSILEQSPLVDGNNKLLRGNPDYIRNTVDMVFGRAARKAGMRFDGKNKTFFLESAGGDGGPGFAETHEDGLSADQRKVFQRMGVPLDQAKKTMAKLKFVS